MSKIPITSMSTERMIFIGIGVFSIIILMGSYWFVSKPEKPLQGKETTSQGATHVARGQSHSSYNSNPPTSGWHWGDGVAGPGIKDKQVPDELVLHSMEHGAAVLWYRDSLQKAEVDKIKNAFNSSSGKKIMIPRKNLDVPVALTSWGRILQLKTVDLAKIKEFIETNNDRAPEKADI